MQLLGIGFSSHDWDILIKQLQEHVSSQIKTKLHKVAKSSSISNNWLKYKENLSIDILNYNPDWLLFTLRKFESAENFMFLLDNLQRNSPKRIRLVMVVQSIQEELNEILTFNPIFELVNKMRFKISAKELLLNHHIPRFPRIRINTEFQVIEYVSDSGSIVKQTPDEIPLHTLIPFKNIRKIHTSKGQLSPGQSVRMILSKHSRITHPKQVVGILREAKACYLFPGIPFNSIKNITFEKTKIEHLIKLDECTENNPPFKRLIKVFLKETAGKYKQKIVKVKQSSPQIVCLCRYSIINNLIKKLLKGIGYTNLVTVEEVSSKDNKLKDYEVLLKLQECNVSDFKGQILDWSKELDKILEPLSQFVLLNDIKSVVNKEPFTLKQTELEDLKGKLLKNEKTALTMKMRAERDQLLYSQEYDVLKKIDPLVTLLTDALSTSTNWENAFKDASEIKLQRALLLCEDENDASEMNFKLTQVERKLWINPFLIQKSEDFNQLKSKTIRSYFKPGSLIIKPAALKHLKKICLQTKQEFKNAKKTFNRQKEIMKKANSELKVLQSKKNNLALSWLEHNLKELLFRDLQVLHLDSSMVE